MGRRQQYVYHVEPEVFPEDFPERLDRFRRAAGFTWGRLARELRVNSRTVRRWKAGSRVGPGHLVSLFALAANLGLLHHLLPETGEPVAVVDSDANRMGSSRFTSMRN